MLKKHRAVLQNFADATQYEWLETNGLGGWAGSTIIGANTRRYHGILTAAIVPPAERMVLLSKLDETIITANKRIELGCNLYEGDTIHPSGHHYQVSFSKSLFPQWEYEVEGIRLRKTIAMVHGENTVVIHYKVIAAPSAFTIKFLPLVAARGYHSLRHEGPELHWDVDFNNGVFHNKPDGCTDLYISIPGSTYQHTPRWFKNFHYAVEEYRGLDHTEDLFNHGLLSVELTEGEELGIIISTEDPQGCAAGELLARESLRRQMLIGNQPDDEMIHQLTLAADQFIVKRDERLKTIIAGYHWFTDWGRDTMISLPGLCLSTGRFEDAKKILAAFARSTSQGMLPNRFQDNGAPPEYNNVDGTLWFFLAIYKYLHASGDKEFVVNELLPVLKDIIEWHHKGTRFHIHDETDGLLYSGEEGVQLTWMDAKVGDWVVTPRTGKAVEIQALWFNALSVFKELLELNAELEEAKAIERRLDHVKESFLEQFWNEEGGYLFDVIENNSKDATFRPNQLFAISLPFALLEGEKARNVLKIVEQKLYAPVGLRSLSQEDNRYVGVYGGDAMHRDSAYHQGTGWTWLLGPFIDALVKVYGERGREKAAGLVDDFRYHLNEACIGSVSEIFDGDPPHYPRGCVAQAWGVGEILRVVTEYRLYAKETIRHEPMLT